MKSTHILKLILFYLLIVVLGYLVLDYPESTQLPINKKGILESAIICFIVLLIGRYGHQKINKKR